MLQDIFCLGQYSGRYKFINSFTFFFSLTIALYFNIIGPNLIRHSNSCLTSLNSFRCALDSEHSGCCDY